MGHVKMVGGNPTMTAPSTSILASELAVGSTVKLMENGSAVEYLVVNQGIPSGSSMYDTSCNGVWLLRKDIYHEKRAWDTTDADYENSDIHAYLNSTFFNLFDVNTKSAIQQVKIPCYKKSGSNWNIGEGSNGVSTKVFLLGGYEVGWTQLTNNYFPVDGASLSYFIGADDVKRMAYLNGELGYWWLRSMYISSTSKVWRVSTYGYANNEECSDSRAGGVRPALVLSNNALFDKNTMILMGVK